MLELSQISLLLIPAAFFGVIAFRFKQPLLVGYLLSGFILTLTGILKDYQLIENFGNLGIIFLLFLVGLEMNIRDISLIVREAFYVGLIQIFLTFLVSLLVGLFIGLDLIVSFYFAFVVSFSSTIISVKLLSEKNTLNSVYGKISVGILVIQDLFAILLLIALSSISGLANFSFDSLIVFLKAFFLFLSLWFLSKKVLPNLFEKYIATSTELIFIFSIAWALGLASLTGNVLGFSFEMGGFLAGIALSNLPEHLEIGSRTKPLKDFFITLFFLSLGAKLSIEGIVSVLYPLLIFSFLVLVVKPLIIALVMGFFNFRKRTSFLTSLTLSQISEFSLKITMVGVSLGHLEKKFLTLTTILAAVTMTTSSYLVFFSDRIYGKLRKLLSFIERGNPKDLIDIKADDFSNHIVLVGCYRTGARLLSFFKNRGLDYLVVDFNPKVYKKLSKENHPVIFGDITDPDILEKAQIDKARMVISTIDGLNENSVILEYISRLKSKPLSIFTSGTRTNAIRMYEKGADYVIVPEIVAGDHIRNLLRIYGFMDGKLRKAGKNHFNRLISF